MDTPAVDVILQVWQGHRSDSAHPKRDEEVVVYFCICTLYCPVGMGIPLAFPKESQLKQESRYPTLINFKKCMLGLFVFP